MNEKITIIGLIGLLVLLNLLSYLYVSFASVIFLISFILFVSVLFIYRKNISGIKFNYKVVLISFIIIFVLSFVDYLLIKPLVKVGIGLDIPSEVLMIFDRFIIILLGLFGIAFLSKKQTNMEKIKSGHILIFILLILILPFAVQSFFDFIAFSAAPKFIPNFQFERAIGSAASANIGSIISFLAIIILFNHFSKRIEHKSLLILLFLVGFIVSINNYMSVCFVNCPEITSFGFESVIITAIFIKFLTIPLLFVGLAFITFLVQKRFTKTSDKL